jgi:5-methylcytosine-specific restriction endonuclease McrA
LNIHPIGTKVFITEKDNSLTNIESIRPGSITEKHNIKIMSKYQRTLVIDSSFMARSIISTERAFVISYKGNAEVIAEHPETFGLVNPKLEIFKPSIIRVYKYVKQNIQKVPLTRENIYRRDNYECVYCGNSHLKSLTLDHVIPQSKGGANAWDNLVTACRSCNSEKADLTLEEYGKEIVEPKRPHYLMLMKQLTYIPKEWETFLFF